MPEAAANLLTIESVQSGYGKRPVLKGVSLELQKGEIVSLIGHNGSGKSTLLKVVFGLLPLWEGKIVYDGIDLNSLSTREMLDLGISYSPQSNHVFTDLTVQENLNLVNITTKGRKAGQEYLEETLIYFPKLKDKLSRPAGKLSGGEKQMVAIARSLITKPKLLLLDEPSLGLSPSLVSQVFKLIQNISQDYKTSILIAEQKVLEVLKISSRTYILRNGTVAFSGTSDIIQDGAKLREFYL